MVEDFMKRMNQQHEKEALLAAQREQELLAQKQEAQEKQVPSPNSVFRQLIEEMYGTKVCEEQKKNMEDTMLELLDDYRQKELYCIHNNVDDLIESAFNSKVLLINLNSQRFDMEKQEVKNIESSISLNNMPQISLVNAITHDLPTEEPQYSLSMVDEHLSTIPETELDEVIKFSVENLVTIPSEFEVTSDNENTLIDSSPKFDYLLEEFSDELAHIDPIPLGNKEADFDLEEEIRLVENLSYDNSSPRPPEDRNSENVDTIIESPSPSPIPVTDSNYLMEEIDLFLASDDSMPPGIENDNYDSERDIHFFEELLSNDSPPLPENESSNLDHFNDPSSSRPPPEPPDVKICFYFEPETGVVTTKVVKGIYEHYVLMPNILPTLPTIDPDSDFTPSHDSLGSGNTIFDPGIFIKFQSEIFLSQDKFSISFIRNPLSIVFDTLLSFSSENEDKVFNPGILSSPLLSHRGKITSDFSKSLMMISRGDIPHLDVPYLYFYPS
ncbi:hypothetical protein Tco_0370115 [Tanacetum coccineum]